MPQFGCLTLLERDFLLSGTASMPFSSIHNFTKSDILNYIDFRVYILFLRVTISSSLPLIFLLQEIRKRGLKVALAGIPKTIDNDIPVSIILPYLLVNFFFALVSCIDFSSIYYFDLLQGKKHLLAIRGSLLP